MTFDGASHHDHHLSHQNLMLQSSRSRAQKEMRHRTLVMNSQIGRSEFQPEDVASHAEFLDIGRQFPLASPEDSDYSKQRYLSRSYATNAAGWTTPQRAPQARSVRLPMTSSSECPWKVSSQRTMRKNALLASGNARMETTAAQGAGCDAVAATISASQREIRTSRRKDW